MGKDVQWARQQASPWQVVVTLVLGRSLFLVGLPFLLAAAGSRLDQRFGLITPPPDTSTAVAITEPMPLAASSRSCASGTGADRLPSRTRRQRRMPKSC